MAGIYLFDKQQFALLYNCNNFSVNDVPLAQRQNIALGSLSIGLFLFFEIAYIPCMFAMWRHLEMSCYKIMFVIGLADIPALWVVALLSGVLSIRGDVYCTAPVWNYVGGMLSIFFWSIETCSACLLAVNRCLEIAFPRVAQFIFGGRRTWLYFAPVLLYSTVYGFFTVPIFWDPVDYYWAFDPHTGYPQANATLYSDDLLDQVHSIAIAIFIPSIYVLFFVLIKVKHGNLLSNQSESQHVVRVIFVQTFLVAMINIANSAAYRLADSMDIGRAMTIFCCTYMWILLHGLPAVIYLSVNRTIRNDCKEMLVEWLCCCRSGKNKVGAAPTTILVAAAPKMVNGIRE